MKKNNKGNNTEQNNVTDIKDTIVGLVNPDPVEQSQEQEIQDFKLKKESERQLAQLSEDEQKRKREAYEKEEKRLEKIKEELLRSIRERIPKIEAKFKLVIPSTKKGKVVPIVKSKTQQKIEKKQADLQQSRNSDEKERE